jgi:hypothetical protein
VTVLRPMPRLPPVTMAILGAFWADIGVPPQCIVSSSLWFFAERVNAGGFHFLGNPVM